MKLKKFGAVLAALLLAAGILTGCTGVKKEAETAKMISQQTFPAPLERKGPMLSHFEGFVGGRVQANYDNWLRSAYAANPYIVEAINQRSRGIDSSLVGWYGEFPGAFLLSAASCYKIDRNEDLYQIITGLVDDIAAAQGEDGYLGPFPNDRRLDGYLSDNRNKVWDIGGHFFMMMGLIEWYEATGSELALDVCKKIADMIYEYHLVENRNIADGTMNQTVIILSMAKLYRITGEPRYLELTNAIENTWRSPYAGDYLEHGYSGAEYADLKNHRWENAFDVQALAEIYTYKHDEKYKIALENLWWSIIKGDRHSTGGFTAGETATGSPYTEGAIETCASIAWAALTIDYYKLTKNSYAIDELEMTTLNALLGAQHPSGRWWTYDTPPEGLRVSAPNELSWQSRAGSPEFNCCMANSARGIGLLNEWTVYHDDGQIYLNYYGPGEFETQTPGGAPLVVRQETDYPRNGNIRIVLNPKAAETFPVAVRIPFWSSHTSISVNGQALETPRSGQYYVITKKWKANDTIELTLDMTPHYWAMEGAHAGQVSIYRGPILLAADKRFNADNAKLAYTLDLRNLNLSPIKVDMYPVPTVALTLTDSSGNLVTLCDFATAGATGTYYTTYFTTDQIPVIPLRDVDRNTILWSQTLQQP